MLDSHESRHPVHFTPGGDVEFDVRDGDERGKRYGVERGHEREFGAILEAKHQRKRRRRQTIDPLKTSIQFWRRWREICKLSMI